MITTEAENDAAVEELAVLSDRAATLTAEEAARGKHLLSEIMAFESRAYSLDLEP